MKYLTIIILLFIYIIAGNWNIYAGKPAARMEDMTAHGGSIVEGYPTVLIGGMPAARVGDMHICPMMGPGFPPVPHIGGPILTGSSTVLIGGMPAARMGDMCSCVGPPDLIVTGCMTVLIGDGSLSGSEDSLKTDITSIDENEPSMPPAVFNLDQNHPNPFNPKTVIRYALPVASHIDLSIYNLLGQKIATLVSEKQQSGHHQVNWDASGFTSGVYFYQLRTNKGFIQTKKLILLR